MKKYQKTALLEVVAIAGDGDYLVQNEGDASDQWIIPKTVFESTYKEIENATPEHMNFGHAFEEAKKGKGMRLPQWSEDVSIRVQYPDEHSKMTAPYLYAESRFGRVPWKETNIELFSDKWEVVE